MAVPLPMHADTVLMRTLRGQRELVQPTLQLDALDRRLLALVNGHTGLHALTAQLGGLRLELVARHLIALGLVDVAPACPPPTMHRYHLHPWAVNSSD